MANATATAAAQKKKADALRKLLRQRNNENAAKWFAVGMGCIMGLFVVFHWARVLYKHYERKKGGNVGFLKFPIGLTRIARSVLLRKMIVFPTVGHSLVFVGYLATTVTIAFINMDWSLPLNNFGKRLGWVAVSNLTLVTFLALKNTPLAILTAYSYERLNVLHRIAGHAFLISVILHATIYTATFAKTHKAKEEILAHDQVWGIVAGLSVLVTVAAGTLMRRKFYELFYVIHVVLFILIVIMVGLHRPDVTKHTYIIVIFIGAIWVADRLIRFGRIIFYSFGNTATLYPLPHGGTRVVLKRSPGFAVAGSHFFLWIPSVRALETHPFTVTSTQPLEFVVTAYDGFTQALHDAATKNPGQPLRASIEGPYGNVPNFTNFTKAVFIAGGSGASFTVGAAIDLLRKPGTSQATTIHFIWAIREPEILEWFTDQLKELAASPLVNLSIYSTRTPAPSIQEIKIAPKPSPPSSKASYDLEKSPITPGESTMQVQSGRPDIPALLNGIVAGAEGNDRVIVAACGPDSLMQTTRRTVAGNIRAEGPSVEFHAEQFGW